MAADEPIDKRSTLIPAKPTRIGVPTAPKGTEVLLPNREIITAFKGDKPRAINKGATIIEGVPKPAIPSKKLSKNQANIITWILKSGEKLFKWKAKLAVTLFFLSISKKKIAPKIIKKMSRATNRPRNKEKPIIDTELCQKMAVIKTVITKVIREILSKEVE